MTAIGIVAASLRSLSQYSVYKKVDGSGNSGVFF